MNIVNSRERKGEEERKRTFPVVENSKAYIAIALGSMCNSSYVSGPNQQQLDHDHSSLAFLKITEINALHRHRDLIINPPFIFLEKELLIN